MPISEPLYPLHCHPLTQAPMVRSVAAEVTRSQDGQLTFLYQIKGDMLRLLIPSVDTENCGESLWEHTCFEAFISTPGSTFYQEFNFSPSGQSATYIFSDYRQADNPIELTEKPQISSTLSVGRLDLMAVVSPTVLRSELSTANLQIGLSAVIESADIPGGNHSYWALHHPAARPDFHHRQSFVLELPLA